MNILMVTSRYAPFAGGVERHIAKVAEQLQGQGHTVTVLTLTNGKQLPAEQRVEGVMVYRVNADGINRTTQLKMAAWALRHRRFLQGLDVVHGHDAYFPALSKVAPKVPQYMTFHGYEGWPVKKESVEHRQKMERAVRKTVCAGSFIGKWYNQRCDLVEWGAVDQPEPHELSEEPSDLCFVGRLEPDTGITAYLEALQILRERGEKLKMVVCGDGSLAEKVRHYRHKGLDIHMVGFVGNPEEYLNASKVACVSGYLSILEAMARRKIVASYYETPIKEDYLKMAPYAKDIIIANTPEDLANALSSALKNPKKMAASLEKNYQFAKKQTWEKLAKDYLALYQA